MKMKVSTRFIFSIYLFVVIAVCLFLLAAIFGLLPMVNLTLIASTMSGADVWLRMLYVVGFIIMTVVSFCLLFFGIRKEKVKTTVISSSDSGNISISIVALEDLAKKFIKQTAAVKVEAIKVLQTGEKVELNVKISIQPEVSIPQITQEMQTGLIQYIEAFSGIKVSKVKITVATINESIKENKMSGSN